MSVQYIPGRKFNVSEFQMGTLLELFIWSPGHLGPTSVTWVRIMAVMIFAAPVNLYFLVFYLVILLSPTKYFTEKTSDQKMKPMAIKEPLDV